MPEIDPLDAFLTAFNRINRYARRGALTHDGQQITRVQWMILRHLRKCGQASIGQLAERMDVRPSTMSQMLDRLERESWIVRDTDPGDSRVRLIRLTDAGNTWMETIESNWHQRLLAPFASLSTDEQDLLVCLTTKLADAIDEGTSNSDLS